MTHQPLIVLSFDGLATSALGCYGSSWNATPAIDAIAAGGCVWDRVIASSDDPRKVLAALRSGSTIPWIEACKARGPVELFSDTLLNDENASGASFDRIETIDLDPPSVSDAPAEDIFETQLGQLIAAAIERQDQPQRPGLLWLHSNFLTHRWDAPRNLIPPAEMDGDEGDGPSEDPELLEAGDVESAELPPLPPVFDDVVPPQMRLDHDSHPDLITSWMRTYGCQVRLVDFLIEVLVNSLSDADPILVVLGTSGFRLGQDRWIGHHVGPLRSPDIHLPLIISDIGPLRMPQLTSSDELATLFDRLARGDDALVDADDWSHRDVDVRVETESTRAQRALTTHEWFFVRDGDESEHLFLKPDDLADFNDVGRLRSDVMHNLSEQPKK